MIKRFITFQNLNDFSKLIQLSVLLGSLPIILGLLQEPRYLFSNNMAQPADELFAVDFEVFGRVQGLLFIFEHNITSHYSLKVSFSER